MTTPEFQIGQTWVSHADAQLGLGIVTDIEGRRVTLSFPAVGEQRTYASDRAPLTRLRFKEGDQVSTIDQEEITVTEVLEKDGLLCYRGLDHHDTERMILELEIDPFVQLTSPQQRLLNGHFDSHAAFRLRRMTCEQLDLLQRSDARGLLGSRTSLLAHQVYIAAEVGRRFAPRVLLADEVGLGKTIEAGMILHQQLFTGRAARVLLLVPETLQHQWLVEMLRRFNLQFALFDAERLAQHGDSNPFESEQLVLAGMDLFDDPSAREQALAAGWDLVIVDEAHHLHWAPDDVGDDYAFVEALAALSPGLLLLTATPEQLGIESHFARLRLLDPARFHSLEQFRSEESRYREWSEVISEIEQGQIPDRLPEDIDTSAGPEAIIEQLMDRHGTGRILFRNTRASVRGFPQRRLHRHPLPEQAAQPGDDLLLALYPELAYEDDDWLQHDPRVDWLEAQLKQLRPEKVLVICAHAATAIALEHHLHLRAGIRSAAFHEGLTILERDRAAAYFADEVGGAQTLVCSEIGSEGRNFQFAHHLILFDLPVNPDLLEQRIGRLDRIGQTRDVEVHVPFVPGSAQETLLDWFDQGLGVFDESCSAGKLILDEFRSSLLKQLRSRDHEFETLIAKTAEFTEKTRRELREGRDRLLERNSCRPAVAEELIDQIQLLERGEELQHYMELACDVFGVDHEFHSERSLVLRPTEHMLTGHFPMLGDEGTSVTFDRDIALSREDLLFLSWEHPMVHETMEMVLGTELGNAALGTIKLRGVPAGTLLLEAIYSVHCVAPRWLQVDRFLPLSPLRLVLDARGKDLSELLPPERLDDLLQPVKKQMALAVIKQTREAVDVKMASAGKQADARLQELLVTAEQQMRERLGAEKTRLEALRRVNPGVRQSEIDHLAQRIEESALHIRHATLQLQALRLIVTT